MKNANIRLYRLFQRYLENDMSESELSEFSGYVDDPLFTDEIQDLLGKAFNEGNDAVSLGETGRIRVLNRILGADELNEKPKILQLWPKIAIAAAVAAILFSVGLFFYNHQQKENAQIAANASGITPGRQGATLTLANGKQVRLADAVNGELAEEAGVIITKTSSGQLIYEVKEENSLSDKINILTTDKGETYQVRLPDGSSVWLNAASTLKYPASFTKLKDRRVELSGEGYFEIAKDKQHPFIVESKGQQVEVLGTHFNINTYSDEHEVKTTLLEGSVKINNQTFLKPGQQAVLSKKGMAVVNADVEMETAWKNGQFIFEGQDFRNLMNTISRWYNVDIIYDYEPTNLHLGGKISKYKSITEVLNTLAGTGDVHFKIEGRRIRVIR